MKTKLFLKVGIDGRLHAVKSRKRLFCQNSLYEEIVMVILTIIVLLTFRGEICAVTHPLALLKQEYGLYSIKLGIWLHGHGRDC